ncbi:MAG: hypothetical protein HZA51_02765 [Planctomycetes bacterium]|nr:hypothetical protein [Planctomycetota bacterium]
MRTRRIGMRVWMAGAMVVGAMGVPACQEYVHMGQISDREGAFSINNVRIEQQQTDGSWKNLGSTDGNGRWWIIKEKINGGGRIRLSKNGYYTIMMGESEFLQQYNIVLAPTGGSTQFGEQGAGQH